MILEKIKWLEHHQNGHVWITGEIGLIAEPWKHLYNYRTGFKGYEGKPVCRLGKWSKYFDNGQLAWTIEYDDYGNENGTKYPQYRKDGTGISYCQN